MMRAQSPSPEVIAAADRVLDAAGRHHFPCPPIATRLCKLLDTRSLAHSLAMKTLPRLKDKQMWGKGAQAALSRVAKSAKDLLADVNQLRGTPLAGRLTGDYPTSAGYGEKGPVPPDFESLLRGIAALHDSAAKLAVQSSPLDAPEQSHAELLIAGSVRRAFNECSGRPIESWPTRSRAKDDGLADSLAAQGAFIDFAVSTLAELGITFAANSVSAALTKGKNVSHGKPARIRKTDGKAKTKRLIKPRYRAG